MKTKYLVFVQFSSDDMDMVAKADAAYQVERATNPEKYPEYATTTSAIMADLPKLTESFKTVEVFEADNPEQMMNSNAYWSAQMPGMKSYKRWYIPLLEVTDAWTAEFSRAR
jgi:hypothetical protein